MTNDGTCRWIIDDIRDGRPVGSLSLDYCIRPGYLVANGRTLNRADYPRLWKWAQDNSLTTSNTEGFLGLFGVGDGSNTFVLPNYDGRWLTAETEGGTTLGATIEAGLPNITDGATGDQNTGSQAMIGAWWGTDYSEANKPNPAKSTVWWGRGCLGAKVESSARRNLPDDVPTSQPGVFSTYLMFDASKSNPIYGKSTTVRPNSISLLPLIKY